ncbi:MAG: hypothetical protein ACRDNJ_06690 [Solirubrobacteraceae bacterium]
MPLQNRATPLGDVISDPARGLVYANRGCLHDDRGRLRRRYSGRRWIACRLEFKGRRRSPLRAPGRYTELFFTDEACAFAAGHRPCAECRREDYERFGELWRELHPAAPGADAIDAELHRQRVEPLTRAQRRHEVPFGELPDGAFVLHADGAWLVLGDQLLAWTPDGYRQRRRRPAPGTPALALTPPSLLAVLAAGWGAIAPPKSAVPLLHPSARAPATGAASGATATLPRSVSRPASARRARAPAGSAR